MFSVGDLYQRLRNFKTSLQSSPSALFFAKVDVQSAFDTIPQSAVVELMFTIPEQSAYAITKHVEIKPADNAEVTHGHSKPKPAKRWQALAKKLSNNAPFLDEVEAQLALRRKHTVFVDNAMRKEQRTSELLTLLATHVEQNLVKVGKKYFRQKKGIPQGSVLSSSLCNYFYADLEKRHLPSLASEDCLLLRLIDDFLLITTNQAKALEFMALMHRGMPDYGVTVNLAKSLVNFDLELDGKPVPRLPEGQAFPYCGTRIDCLTLDIARDRDNVKDPGTVSLISMLRGYIVLTRSVAVISNALTVEYGRLPGQNFERKVLSKLHPVH